MFNSLNKLNLKPGSWVRVCDLKEGITVAIPTRPGVANARVLSVSDDGFISVHWKSNFNLNGDFRSELMQFDSNLVLDEGDLEKRNQFREKHGLVPISL